MLLFPEPVAADFARVQPIAFKACLLRAQRRFHATGYTRAGRVNTQTTHKCSVERAKAGVCCRILPARGLWRALLVVPPCRAPASRAAYFADIPFFVRRVPSKAMLVTGFGNTTKKRAAFLPPRPEIKRIPRSLFLDIPFINPYNKHREFPCNIKSQQAGVPLTLQALLSGERAPSSNPIWDTAIKYHYTFPRE